MQPWKEGKIITLELGAWDQSVKDLTCCAKNFRLCPKTVGNQ